MISQLCWPLTLLAWPPKTWSAKHGLVRCWSWKVTNCTLRLLHKLWIVPVFSTQGPHKTCGTALSRMITDNLSGAKGTTQSSAIIWPSLNSSSSLGDTSWHHPIANLLVPQPPQWHPITLDYLSPLFHTLSTIAPGSVFILIQAFIHYRCSSYYYYLCRIVTLFCIVLYCNLGVVLQYCVVIFCVIVLQSCECLEQWINLCT